MVTRADLKILVNDLYKFYRFFVASGFKENLHADHIEILSKELMKMYRGDYHRLCVAQPPRTSKSSLITLTYPFWLFVRNPKLNILIVNNSANLSERFGIQLRELFIKYGDLFNIKLSDKKHSNSYLMFNDKDGNLYPGSIRLVGAGGSITGQDADYIILDDIYSGFADITPTLLQKKIDWFKTIIEQRIEPHTRLLILHTRWHSNDLQGYLKQNAPNDYKFISFSALNDDGSCIWSERYTVDDFKQKAQSMGERLFSAIYQQKPLDETGDFFNIDNIFYEDDYDPKTSHVIAMCRSWDLAYSDESKGQLNDSTAGVLMYRTYDDRYIIKGLEHGQYGDGLIKHIQNIARADTPRIPILIETGTVGGASEFLFKEYKSKLTGFNVEQSLPVGAKIDRATPFKNAILDGKIGIVLDDFSRGKLLEQLKSFPLGAHDDIVDACSYAFNYLNKKDSKIVTGGKRRRKRL